MTDLPAYLLGPRRQVGQDSVQGMGMPPLPYITIADNMFTLVDAAGNKMPVPTMGVIDPSVPNSPHGPYLDAVLIDANKVMSKAYYPDAWRKSDDGGYKPPECWSDNGIGPSVNATKPFAKLCGTCPNDRWGSAVNAQGNEVKACHDIRKMAWIIPDLWRAGTQTVFLLRMKGGSFKNWRTYHDSIIRNRVGDRAMDPTDLVTRIYFESQGVLKFRAVQLIDEDMAQAQDRIWREKVTDRLLGKGDVPISELPSSDRQDRQALPSQAEINTGHPPPPPPSSAQWDRGWQTPAAPQQGFLPQSAPSPATNTQEPPQRRIVDLHAETRQQVRGHVAPTLVVRHILRRHAHDRLPRIATFGQQAFCSIQFAWALEDFTTLLIVERHARREVAWQWLPHLLIVDIGTHIIFLAHRHQDCAPCPHVIEWREQMIEEKQGDVAERVLDCHRHIAVLCQRRHQVGERQLQPIDFAAL